MTTFSDSAAEDLAATRSGAPYNPTIRRIFELRLRNGFTYALRSSPDGRITIAEHRGEGDYETVAFPVEFASALVALHLSSERDE